jgi:predicted dehydrogenase
MKDARVRIGFVGVGGMGQAAHLRNYATIPECEVAALSELRPELGRKVAAKYGIPKVYRTFEEMLAKEKLDALVASQPFTRHGTLIPEVLKAGIPVFTEKPLAASVPMGEKIVAAAKASGTWHMVGYHKRSDPATMYAKAEIDRLRATKELGRLTYVRVLMPAGDWVANGFMDNVGTEEKTGALVEDPRDPSMDESAWKAYIGFVNYYIHQVNLLRHLLGEPYTVAHADPTGVLLVGRSASGVPCTLEMTPYQTTIDWQESALVTFEKGYVRLDLPAPLASNRPGTVEILRDPGNGAVPVTSFPQLPWVHAMRQQAINFIRAVRGEMKPLCDSVEALEDLKVAREYLRLWKGA